MELCSQITIALAAIICPVLSLAQPTAASHPAASRKATLNAAWTRDYAAAFDPSKAQGVGRDIKWDSRFMPLLTAALPQKQWFWFDHYHFSPVGEVARTFLGVPGSAILDDNRYVSADGCVPHACMLRGMLWIDTISQPAALIFAATGMVTGDQDSTHLWLFGSAKLDWQHLPPPFLNSLHRWIQTIGTKGYSGTNGYRYQFALVTIVQPNGEQTDISPSTLKLASTITEDKGKAQ